MDDYLQLSRVVAEYARRVDARDYEALAQLFAAGSRVGTFERIPAVNGLPATYGEGRWRDGGTTFAEGARATLASFALTFHFLGQQTFDIGRGSADGQVSCLAHHVYRNDEKWINWVVGIRYVDKYVQASEGWLFEERRVMKEWSEYRDVGGLPTDEGWQPSP